MEIDLEEIAKSLPPEAQPALKEAGYFEADRLRTGDAAPRLSLMAKDEGRPVQIGGAGRPRLMALIFGSYT